MFIIEREKTGPTFTEKTNKLSVT